MASQTNIESGKEEEEKKKKILWPQYIAGIGVTLLLNQVGLSAGWSSPYIAQLTDTRGPFAVTKNEASWVVSMLNLGRLTGAVAGSICVNYFGSKSGILITSVPCGLNWVFTIVADRVEWLYAARFCGGLGLGMSYSSFPLYLGEIADPMIRGGLVTLGMCGMSAGNLMICIMGGYLSMKASGGICLGLAIALFLLFCWLPESPHHLIVKKNTEGARKSIKWYQRDCDVEGELDSLTKFVTASAELSFFKTLAEFRVPYIRKAMLVCMMLFVYSQMCGLNNILFYMESILTAARVTSIEPSVVVMIVMVFGIFASGLSVCLIDRYGRRCLMIMSCTLVSIALLSLGTRFALINSEANLEWLPILALIIFQISCFAGILPVPSAVLGELFAPHVKCVAACIGSICAGSFSFISTATYQPLIDLMSEQYTFYFYAVLQLSAIPIILVFMPETKGKSLQQIQSELSKA